MRIGARIIKTGIAVTITMFICKVLNLEPAFFGAVSAVINMQPSIFLTVKTARDQILVHLLGVGAGLLFGYLLGGNPLVMGLVTIIMISVYLKLNLQSGISMGIVAAVFVLGSSQEQFLPHALNRSAVIFAGLTTAMLVNILLWPPRYSNQFKTKLQESSEQVVLYFCRAIQEYVQIENARPVFDQKYKEKVHKLNQEVRHLAVLLKREGEVSSFGPLKQREWLIRAEKLLDYNETLTEKADRIYELVPQRFERRQAAGALPVSNEFKVILEILQSGCSSVSRLNGKLQQAIIEEQPIEAEEISEDYWEKLTKAIEEWQPKLTGSYYIHPLIEAAVMASEIKWASRQAKKLLQEVTAK
ncbi:aromatic acid exporter family member 1 [Anaerospora hongkongensis]|uniref:Aromatic acid exporter family member 1 n=2 Tax=Anaerospora hongkongensis TaxID=244830 RepID=A0A4R1PX13_9FIRM|nr:aromatic acid exporter family protein [Anaerospora hongkongensis]TCL36954.1 aromatic acid exporter family member 1 [Anaerospora hongkongensis]